MAGALRPDLAAARPRRRPTPTSRTRTAWRGRYFPVITNWTIEIVHIHTVGIFFVFTSLAGFYGNKECRPIIIFLVHGSFCSRWTNSSWLFDAAHCRRSSPWGCFWKESSRQKQSKSALEKCFLKLFKTRWGLSAVCWHGAGSNSNLMQNVSSHLSVSSRSENPELAIILSTSLGSIWNTIWPFIRKIKSEGWRPALAAGDSGLTVFT